MISEQETQYLEDCIERFGCVFATDAKRLIEIVRKENLCQDTPSSPV